VAAGFDGSELYNVIREETTCQMVQATLTCVTLTHACTHTLTHAHIHAYTYTHICTHVMYVQLAIQGEMGESGMTEDHVPVCRVGRCCVHLED